MATYKAEFLAHHYARRLRPAAHYALGWLPLWARLARYAPRLVKAALHAPGLAALGKKLAGIAPERDAPRFAEQSFQDWWCSLGRPVPRPGDPHTVVLWPDTFTNYFDPHIARAAVAVLERAGFTVAVPTEPVCCGLTWISTGQLGTARRKLAATVAALRPPGTLVLADGISCRTQIGQAGTGRRAMHLAEALAATPDEPSLRQQPKPALRWGRRGRPRVAAAVTAAGVGVLAARHLSDLIQPGGGR
jgi:hypothetical protein